MNETLERVCAQRRTWGVLVGLGLALRVVAWLERADRATLTGMLDTRTYRILAEGLLENGLVGDQAFFMSPLYPYLIALIEKPFGAGALLLLQILWGMAGLIVLARAARELGGPVAEATVLLFGAAAPPLILYDTSLLPDGPATACVALAVGGVVLAERWGRRALWMAGAASAVGIALRSNLLLLFLLLAAGWLWRGRHRRTATLRGMIPLALPVLIALGLLSGHNAVAEGLWAPRSYNGGINLYLGNNPASEGTYTTINEIHPGDPMGRAAAQRARGRELDSAEVEDFWREQALRFVRENPGRALELVLVRAGLFLHPLEIPQMEDLELSARESRVLAWAPVGFGLLLGLAILGVWQPLRRASAPRWPLVVALLSAVAVALVFFVNGRLRMPVWPALLVLAAMGVVQLVEAYRQRRVAPLIAPLLVVLVLRVAPMLLPVHETYLHARSAARYAAIEALADHPAKARRWLLVMDEYVQKPSAGGEGRAIEASFEARPDSRYLLKMEKAAALFALGSDGDAFEELLEVVQARPSYRRAWRGLLDVTGRLLQAGSQDPRVRRAHELARRRVAPES